MEETNQIIVNNEKIKEPKPKKIKPFCECCNYTAPTPSQWQQHLVTKKHTDLSQGLSRRKMYECEHCWYVSKVWGNLERHKKTAYHKRVMAKRTKIEQ